MKDQESNPRPHTPRPAALPVKVEQWVSVLLLLVNNETVPLSQTFPPAQWLILASMSSPAYTLAFRTQCLLVNGNGFAHVIASSFLQSRGTHSACIDRCKKPLSSETKVGLHAGAQIRSPGYAGQRV